MKSHNSLEKEYRKSMLHKNKIALCLLLVGLLVMLLRFGAPGFRPPPRSRLPISMRCWSLMQATR